MFKRVVRRALDGRRSGRQAEQALEPAKPVTPEPESAAPSPPPTPPRDESSKPKPAGTSIAARIAAGQAAAVKTSVSATSGAVSPTAQGLSTAEDGTTYWGQLNNESARAKGRGETLVIDQWECISCGTCVENTDAVFTLPDDAKAVVVQQQGDMALIQDAIDACPVTCIHWTEEPNEFEQLNDANGKPA